MDIQDFGNKFHWHWCCLHRWQWRGNRHQSHWHRFQKLFHPDLCTHWMSNTFHLYQPLMYKGPASRKRLWIKIKLKLAFKVNYCQEETIFLSLHLLTASGLAATVSLTVKGLCWGNNGLVVVGLSDNNGEERTGGELVINFLFTIFIGFIICRSSTELLLSFLNFPTGIFLLTSIFLILGSADIWINSIDNITIKIFGKLQFNFFMVCIILCMVQIKLIETVT